MLQRVKEVQESDLRMDGALARNIQRVIAVTQAQIDAAAAQGKAWVVKPVVKVSDPIDNLRGETQLVIKQNSILPGQNVMRVIYMGGTAVVVGPDVPPLSLPDATANDLLSLTAFGGTEQNGTPTPDVPVDIVCNNGVLTFTPNLLDMASENIVLGKYIDNGGVVTDSGPNFYNSKYIPVSASQTYTWSTSSSIGYLSIMEYDSSYTFRKRTLFSNAGTSGSITLRSDTAFVLIGSNMDGTDVTLDKVAAVDWQFELGSSATSYRPYSENRVYTPGPIETIAIKDDQNATVSTATAEMLLSLLGYNDQQEVITGGITRKIGITVFDGTENWSRATNQDGSANYVFYTQIDEKKIGNSMPMLCTHYVYVGSVSYVTLTTGKFLSNSANTSVYFDGGSITTVTNWKNWLAAQYAAGTPVIVIYPLAAETTETVAGQPMQTAAGDNTAEITQAGMAGLELEVEYLKDE